MAKGKKERVGFYKRKSEQQFNIWDKSAYLYLRQITQDLEDIDTVPQDPKAKEMYDLLQDIQGKLPEEYEYQEDLCYMELYQAVHELAETVDLAELGAAGKNAEVAFFSKVFKTLFQPGLNPDTGQGFDLTDPIYTDIMKDAQDAPCYSDQRFLKMQLGKTVGDVYDENGHTQTGKLDRHPNSKKYDILIAFVR